VNNEREDNEGEENSKAVEREDSKAKGEGMDGELK
jgi:hypothetical protein